MLSSAFIKGKFYGDVAFVLYNTNENAAVSHYINLMIFTLPSLSTCGANEILLMVLYNLTPFSSTQKDVCV